MPRNDVPPKPPTPCAVPRVTGRPTTITVEANAFIQGLFDEFRRTASKYEDLTKLHFEIEARIEMTEKTLCLMRDHLAMSIASAEHAATPHDWEPLFKEVRFVGVRLVDACMTLLQEQGKMKPEELLLGLNGGMFRFRTNSPLREIHAALLKQKRRVRKILDTYVWVGGGEQIAMRLKLAERPQASNAPQTPTPPQDSTGTEGQ
jgi:hypothetical protein